MHQPEPSGEPARPAARRPELCEPGTTKCQARTRLYRGGELVAQGFPVANIRRAAQEPRPASWVEIIAVPTLITDLYGMNVPYPGFDSEWGFLVAMIAMVIAMIVLYRAFRHRDWL